LVLWCAFSILTSLTNKFILSTRNGDPNVLAMAQILTTTLLGGIKMNTPCCLNQYIHAKPSPDVKHTNFIRNMAFVGIMRFTTVVLGLISLKYVAVSFTETIKSSAPIFTVGLAWIMLQEKTGVYVNLALLPVTAGLALCSATEIGFNMLGFLAAVSNNIVDCIQNVFSKKLLSGEHYTPVELQFYTSAAAAVVQIPLWFYNVCMRILGFHLDDIVAIDKTVAIMMVLNSLGFHLQSVTAYVLMADISPVSHSVANTAKRALLILLSILIFHNPVTVMNIFGILIVILGVVLYNRAREYEK
ncbi:uncharacterized protein TRIADDRAFT_3406, partial [Trichoplax adhaerens]